MNSPEGNKMNRRFFITAGAAALSLAGKKSAIAQPSPKKIPNSIEEILKISDKEKLMKDLEKTISIPPIPLGRTRYEFKSGDLIQNISEQELNLLTWSIFHEVGGEKDLGTSLQAVLLNILERYESRKYPGKINEVVLDPNQYSWTHYKHHPIPIENLVIEDILKYKFTPKRFSDLNDYDKKKLQQINEILVNLINKKNISGIIQDLRKSISAKVGFEIPKGLTTYQRKDTNTNPVFTTDSSAATKQRITDLELEEQRNQLQMTELQTIAATLAAQLEKSTEEVADRDIKLHEYEMTAPSNVPEQLAA